jgi:hypothetical protein
LPEESEKITRRKKVSPDGLKSIRGFPEESDSRAYPSDIFVT